MERVETVPATGAVTGFTVGVTNDLADRTSAIVLNPDVLDNNGGVLATTATLLAGAAYSRARSSHRSATLQGSVSPSPTSAGAAFAEAAASADPSVH